MSTTAALNARTLQCTVCAALNDDFSITCSSCGSFLQDRVAYLDFFATLWQMIESPKAAFRRAVLSEQKNYIISMMLFLGVGAMFALLSLRHAGSEFDNLLFLMLYGIVLGTLLGPPLGMIVITGLHLWCRFVGGRATFRNSYAVVGWSLVPIVISVALLLPIELAAMGMLLFIASPSAAAIKPIVYYTLAGLDVAFVLWAIALAGYGCSIAHRLPVWKTMIGAILVCSAAGAIFFAAFAHWIV
jgi:hypothetical protein